MNNTWADGDPGTCVHGSQMTTARTALTASIANVTSSSLIVQILHTNTTDALVCEKLGMRLATSGDVESCPVYKLCRVTWVCAENRVCHKHWRNSFPALLSRAKGTVKHVVLGYPASQRTCLPAHTTHRLIFSACSEANMRICKFVRLTADSVGAHVTPKVLARGPRFVPPCEETFLFLQSFALTKISLCSLPPLNIFALRKPPKAHFTARHLFCKFPWWSGLTEGSVTL